MDVPEQCFLLPESIRRPLLDYLETRPYGEVAQGIAALVNLQPITQPSEESVTS